MTVATTPTRQNWARAAAVAAAILALACAARTAAAQERPAPMDRSYDILLRRSIFSKDRARPDPRLATTAPATRASAPLSPEQSVVFRGVLCPDEEYVAFIENIQTGQMNIVKTGDEIARGRVAGITLDTLQYDSGGKVHPIQLGQNLAGELAASGSGTGGSGGMFSTAPSSGISGATTAPPSDPAQAAVLERLRQRRLEGK
jgi:hypothetical protein